MTSTTTVPAFRPSNLPTQEIVDLLRLAYTPLDDLAADRLEALQEKITALKMEVAAGKAEIASLTDALAACRDAAGTPEGDAESGGEAWAALGDPASVPMFVEAQFSALRARVRQLGGS